MRYTLKSGILFTENQQPVARISTESIGSVRTIALAQTGAVFCTRIQNHALGTEKSAAAQFHEYLLEDDSGKILLRAQPVFLPKAAPSRIDHAQLHLYGAAFRLVMADRQHYYLEDSSGRRPWQLVHRGLVGGWCMDTRLPCSAQILCGLFLFCRYLEQELTIPYL